MEGVPYRSTMNKKIDKAALASRIYALEGLSPEHKSALLELLSEQKRYGLVWEDSPEEVETLLREKLPVLTEDTTKRILSPMGELEGATPNHILIEGDNYPTLVALQYAYEGKVDVIYIDPPYNTGNKDFVYNDSYVDSEDSYRHSKWLSFMSKRLRIAKRLLSDRGVIFISIDDNEQANLKLLCDKLFTGMDFIATIPWRKRTAKSDVPHSFSQDYEWVQCYCKKNFTAGLKKENRKYYETDDLPDRPWRIHDLTQQKSAEERPKSFFDIINPKNGKHYPANPKNAWRITSDTFPEYLAQNRIVFPGDYPFLNISKPVLRYFKADDEAKAGQLFGFTTVSTDLPKEVGMTQEGTKDINDIFETKVFSFPKPLSLIKYLLQISTPLSHDITILDFFAGSGTTLHATMQLNAEDGGNRRCILVTNNENNICEEVTYERNKRVIQGYTTPKGQQVEGLKNNNLRYYKVGFVDREKTAANQKELMKASTDLLCIKEDLYQEEKSFEGLKLHEQIARCFTDGKDDGKKMLIIYEPAAIPAIVKRIEQMTVGEGNKLKVYVMAEGQYPYTEDFETVLGKIELRALPHALYQAMRQVLPPPAEAENSEPDMEVSDEEADGSIYKSEEL